ncbi:MAG: EscU/YscU/HrcU family type III secretion system export apparatus switch protein, partial [Bdellovibrionia bacterium]
SGLRRLFSLKQLFEGLRMILKVAVVLAVCYSLIKNSVLKVESYSQAEPLFILTQLGKNGKSVFLNLFGIMIAFAGIDFYFQREEYQKNLRLTKQEAKQEQKEREGDPLIRSRIRAVQREMARRRMMDAVKKATVIVTNPTHIAVALVYDNKSMSAPKVVAKGADLVAQKIKEVARQAGVPLVENVPLARTLFKTVKIGQVVPRSLYQAIAEVLVYVYRLKRGDL